MVLHPRRFVCGGDVFWGGPGARRAAFTGATIDLDDEAGRARPLDEETTNRFRQGAKLDAPLRLIVSGIGFGVC